MKIKPRLQKIILDLEMMVDDCKYPHQKQEIKGVISEIKKTSWFERDTK